MKKIILILTGLALSFSVMAENHINLGKGSQTENFFKIADSDQDGKVSYAEHEAFVAIQADKGRERFNSIDSNSDGFVTKKEARKAMKTKRKGMRKKRKELRKDMKDLSDKDKTTKD